MKNPKSVLAILALVSLPLGVVQADNTIFSDSFENDGTGYNLPDSGSTPPYNAPVASGGGTTALTQVRAGYAADGTTPNSYYISGQAGLDYLVINTSGSNTSTDTITTKNGDAGFFEPNSTYTVSVLMAQPQFGGDGSPGNLFTGTLELLNGTTGAVLDSASYNFAAGGSAFTLVSFKYDTAGLLNPAQIPIQLGVQAQADTGSFQEIDFDNLTITIPEPSTWALALFGGVLVFGLGRYRRMI